MEETTKTRTDDAVGACNKDAENAFTSTNAATKRTKMTNMLTILDENSLLQVLLRTRCEDHNALRKTCRCFQSIIDSDLFRQQRAQQEWAQVETQLLTAEEYYREASEFPEDDPEDLDELSFFRDNYCKLGYKHDCGAIENEFRILVDGKLGGSGKFQLIERNTGQSDFLATCDAASQEVHSTACLFFDKRGRPRMPSLKEAMGTSNNNNNNTGTGSGIATSSTSVHKNYFVNLEKFELNPEHRGNGTYVGAKAIRSLLLDSPLKDKWSVVIYIADPDACFSDQDKNRCADQRDLYYYGITGGSEQENEWRLREKNNWKERLRSLAKVDLCQFLRCGFKQPTESLQKISCLYAMAIPMFLSGPMLSHEQALAVNIVDRTDLPFHKEMSLMDSKLWNLMINSCPERNKLGYTIGLKQDTPLPTREPATALSSARADLIAHDSKVKAEVAKLVGENNDGASVYNSNALHACVVYLIPEYIDLLLEFTPPAERRCALNKYNKQGITPLMAVAMIRHNSGNLQGRIEMAEKLIGLGADKNITDIFGETALGKFRAMMQSFVDDQLTFGMQPPQDDSEDRVGMERVLRPIGGPTAADESYLDDSDDDLDDSDVDSHWRWYEED